MTSSITLRRLMATTVIGAFLALGSGAALAQDINSELSALEAQMMGPKWGDGVLE